MPFSNTISTDLRQMALEIQARKNRVEKIWSFLSPDSVLDMPTAMDFGDDRFQVSIIDQFAQCRPRLMNYRSLDDRDVMFAPSVILDSNVSTYITQYVVAPDRLIPERRNTIKALIEHLVRTKYDYTPFFYYIEALVKDNQSRTDQHLVTATEAVLRLHSMDEALFLQTGEIRPALNTFDHYAEKFGTNSYAEMALRQVAWSRAHNPFPELQNMYFAIYVCLLKMALIHLKKGKSIQQKYVQLREFMIDNLRVVMGRELYVGLNYFAGLLQGFIPFHRGAHFARVVNRCQAAAWDIPLLSLPDHFLAHGWPEPVTLAYVCSADRALQRIGKATRILAILCLEPYTNSPRSLLQYGYGEIARKVGDGVVDALIQETEQWQSSRWRSSESKFIAPNEEGLPDIIRHLEGEIQLVCAK